MHGWDGTIGNSVLSSIVVIDESYHSYYITSTLTKPCFNFASPCDRHLSTFYMLLLPLLLLHSLESTVEHCDTRGVNHVMIRAVDSYSFQCETNSASVYNFLLLGNVFRRGRQIGSKE